MLYGWLLHVWHSGGLLGMYVQSADMRRLWRRKVRRRFSGHSPDQQDIQCEEFAGHLPVLFHRMQDNSDDDQ